jgi:hypothetical protein
MEEVVVVLMKGLTLAFSGNTDWANQFVNMNLHGFFFVTPSASHDQAPSGATYE